MEDEEAYRDHMPENLQGSEKYERADAAASNLDDAVTVMGGAAYYVSAPDDAAFPYAVFSFQSVNLGDLSRDDIELCVDLWDHAATERTIEDRCDLIEALFNAGNFPTSAVLPTVWRESRYPVREDDKSIRHIQMIYYIQNYERT